MDMGLIRQRYSQSQAEGDVTVRRTDSSIVIHVRYGHGSQQLVLSEAEARDLFARLNAVLT